jgi:hypothetical protein
MAAFSRRSITADTSFAAQGFRLVQVVPEPSTGCLLVAMGILAMVRRRGWREREARHRTAQ